MSKNELNTEQNLPLIPELQDTKEETIQDVLRTQIEDPHGKDPFNKLFAEGMLAIMHRDPELVEQFKAIQDLRAQPTINRPITTTHMANLALRAFNHIMMFNRKEKDIATHTFDPNNDWYWDYPQPHGLNLDTPEKWAQTISDTLLDPDLKLAYWQLLLDRDTQTNIAERRVGLHILPLMFGLEEPLTIVEGGCSNNALLAAIDIGNNDDIKKIKDNTPGQTMKALINSGLHLAQGVGFDINNPHEENIESMIFDSSTHKPVAELSANTKWFLSCRYAGEVQRAKVEQTLENMNTYSSTPHTELRNGNILNPPDNLPSAHAYLLSTVCYQLPSQQTVDTAITKGFEIVREKNGVVLVQDFAIIDPQTGHLVFPENWGADSYRLFVLKPRPQEQIHTDPYLAPYIAQEVLIYDSGRCREVKPGADWQTFLENCTV